ncbi:unnamed protein product [Sphagnum jensenii]|uniref:Uncharacterized protein n=1 Tax=Sphagnum jensenii TaxID=128206 RepID=A0ABP0X280_9BRYO
MAGEEDDRYAADWRDSPPPRSRSSRRVSEDGGREGTPVDVRDGRENGDRYRERPGREDEKTKDRGRDDGGGHGHRDRHRRDDRDHDRDRGERDRRRREDSDRGDRVDRDRRQEHERDRERKHRHRSSSLSRDRRSRSRSPSRDWRSKRTSGFDMAPPGANVVTAGAVPASCHLCLSTNVSAKACLYNVGVWHPFPLVVQHASFLSGDICFFIPVTGTLAYTSCQHQKVLLHKVLHDCRAWVLWKHAYSLELPVDPC